MKTENLLEHNTVVWQPEGELEDPAQMKDVMQAFRESGAKRVLLNLLEKEWLSSSEIGVVMWIFKELD
ncbi:MAG: hypothetical protein HQ517_11090, partial [SAR324 cluster bacterium]|nr:hypothetical protein [SAR324 cluster bacterium]